MDNRRPYSGVIDILKQAGLRPTSQRLALARLLFEGADRHITAEMLHAEATAANIRVSVATVYNALHQFRRAGLLREIVVDSQRAYFDTNLARHHHFYREDTGALEDIRGDAVEIAQVPAAPKGTRVQQVDVVIRLAPDDLT
ncbi:MAG: Fur family transcriptional regulator [Rhodospirillaceae bacterium]